MIDVDTESLSQGDSDPGLNSVSAGSLEYVSRFAQWFFWPIFLIVGKAFGLLRTRKSRARIPAVFRD